MSRRKAANDSSHGCQDFPGDERSVSPSSLLVRQILAEEEKEKEKEDDDYEEKEGTETKAKQFFLCRQFDKFIQKGLVEEEEEEEEENEILSFLVCFSQSCQQTKTTVIPRSETNRQTDRRKRSY